MVDMKQCRTIDRGKLFFYEDDPMSGLIVQTADENGEKNDTKIHISANTITFIKRKIKTSFEIPMGSCRDNPAPGSLGHLLMHKNKTSPQILCYVIPLLVEKGFCTTVKEKRAIVIKLCKQR